MTTGPVRSGKLPVTPSRRLQCAYWAAPTVRASEVAAAPQCQSRTMLASASRSTVSTRYVVPEPSASIRSMVMAP